MGLIKVFRRVILKARVLRVILYKAVQELKRE